MTMRYPFLSVITISYNGASTIARTLDSLVAQDYPSDKYEIIVVDDGSTDDTAAIASRYPVALIRKSNGGISSARNAGLEAAKGEIYVTMDDDCIAAPDLLTRLAHGYENGEPLGVGGAIVQAQPVSGVVARYIHATGAGTTHAGAPATSLSGRFIQYLVSKFAATSAESVAPIQVAELYGANGSYRVVDLRAIGGWSIEMSGIEDRDLSQRLREAFPGRPFFAVPSAKIIHDPDLSLSAYLLRPWKRGPQNFLFHHRNHITPPIFPFPLAVAALSLVATAISPWLGLVMIFILPLALYFWWIVRAVKEAHILYVLFPYLQMAEETVVIAGLVRGYYALKRGHRA